MLRFAPLRLRNYVLILGLFPTSENNILFDFLNLVGPLLTQLNYPMNSLNTPFHTSPWIWKFYYLQSISVSRFQILEIMSICSRRGHHLLFLPFKLTITILDLGWLKRNSIKKIKGSAVTVKCLQGSDTARHQKSTRMGAFSESHLLRVHGYLLPE